MSYVQPREVGDRKKMVAHNDFGMNHGRNNHLGTPDVRSDNNVPYPRSRRRVDVDGQYRDHDHGPHVGSPSMHSSVERDRAVDRGDSDSIRGSTSTNSNGRSPMHYGYRQRSASTYSYDSRSYKGSASSSVGEDRSDVYRWDDDMNGYGNHSPGGGSMYPRRQDSNSCIRGMDRRLEYERDRNMRVSESFRGAHGRSPELRERHRSNDSQRRMKRDGSRSLGPSNHSKERVTTRRLRFSDQHSPARDGGSYRKSRRPNRRNSDSAKSVSSCTSESSGRESRRSKSRKPKKEYNNNEDKGLDSWKGFPRPRKYKGRETYYDAKADPTKLYDLKWPVMSKNGPKLSRYHAYDIVKEVHKWDDKIREVWRKQMVKLIAANSDYAKTLMVKSEKPS
ncbi:uncharacterized protein BXIN_2139 [Babesia sp. Xinjiang]|uniref:uncharacterized protein n=1 Tax=Babesia sp. Xinjiang TaxID=462227 RepID=UPI000A25B762|nr:uncharacterized protein BXIN_2139 [Babesia sp. Xinjiang]ORM40526.1 hypothetical protein BXIN_2139 [Babesia sp. Xinjiang]